MRQGVGRAFIAGFTALLVWAPGALAATPQDIYKDLADNGRLDATYTQAELQAFLQSASVQGYGNPVVVPPIVSTPPPTTVTLVPPAAVATPATPTAPASGVAGTAKTIVNKKPRATAPKPTASVAGVATPAQAPLARTATAGTLPFTGVELGLFALVGGALLLGGLLLRASARQR